MENWGFRKNGETYDNWPLGEDGKPVQPAFLEHLSGSQLDVELTVNLLEAYDIPVMAYYPNDGEFGKLILGFAGTGVDVYVPVTLLEDARNIISSDIAVEGEECPAEAE